MLLSNMKEWIISLASVSVIFCIVSIILPEGKTGRLIKIVFSLILLLIMLKPVVNFTFDNVDFQSDYNVQSVIMQTDYLDYVLRQKVANYQNNCKKIAGNLGIKVADVRIEYNVTEEHNLIINIVDLHLVEEGANFDEQVNNVKQSISEYLNVDVAKVKVNGR